MLDKYLDAESIFSASSNTTIVDILRFRYAHQPSQLAYTFLPDGETEENSLTYQELDRQARAIAAKLQALGLSGERAILLYPSGLDYIAAFFGCLYAKVIAVPAYPPRNKRGMPRIRAILEDAQAKCALTSTTTLSSLKSFLIEKTDFGDLQWITTDNIDSTEHDWKEICIDKDTLAFLQYTSGSTGIPKGVMLNHGNLMHNAAMTYRLMEHSPTSKFVSWLPIYHDMGLIGGILQPLYGNFPCVLIPPVAFLQRPYRWLQAISRYQGTTSGAPNFAYELCIHKVTPEQQQTLDLSSWSVAFNGAEPIRNDTLERFCTKFASCGFRPQTFYPCYGMAEATLMVSGGLTSNLFVTKTIDKSVLEHNQVIDANADAKNQRVLVGCGQALPEQQIVIVNPETLSLCSPSEVGEIWVSGPSVGQGYWNRPEKTQQTFQAYVADTNNGPFLRTGDLGFLSNGELFVTGRVKDLIIVRGRNLYPQDIELTVERSHPALRPNSGSAFSVEIDREEQLFVVQELEFRQKADVEEVITAIRQTIVEEHEIQAYGVVLIKAGSIPKTTSGKIQRRACQAEFLAGRLQVVKSSILTTTTDSRETSFRFQRDILLSIPEQERQSLVEAYLLELVAKVLRISPSQINLEQPLSSFGLDSLKIFELKNQIEVDLEVAISIADFFEGLKIAQLAAKILAQLMVKHLAPSIPFVKVERTKEAYSLSLTQQRLWFIDQLDKGNPAYNISFALRCKGALNVAVLEQSLNELVRRHESLRTTFNTVNSQPIQVITPSLRLPLAVEDYQNLPESECDLKIQQFATQESQQPFDLRQGPLLRVKLVCLAPKEHILILTIHHIISDEWSIEVLLYEMAAIYKNFLIGKPSGLPELPIQYIDFAYWQQQWLQGELLETQLSYWKKQLENAPTILQLPTDFPRPAIQSYRGAQHSLELSESLTKALRELARQEGVTLFMLLLAAFQVLLYRYTEQEDICIGSPIANRNREEVKGLIGFFVNILVLRTNLGENPSFCQLLTRVRQVATGAYIHQDLPFDLLVKALQPERDMSYAPLFQVGFTFQNTPVLPEIPDLALTPFKVDSLTVQLDLKLHVEVAQQDLVVSFEYNTDLFHPDTIKRMLGHFQNLLEDIVTNPQAKISELQLLTQAERHQMLVEWNNTRANYQLSQCIHQLFEAKVEEIPHNVALVLNNEKLTYWELNQRANQLAHYLKKLGVQPEVLVGICLERSLDMIVGILGILKAGGAYVPLDPTYPTERLEFMLADAGVPLLLTAENLTSKFSELKADIVCLDTSWEKISQESQENPVNDISSANLAYVIYTSGSTGKPKGVLIAHRGLCNLIAEIKNRIFDKQTDRRVLQFAPFSFDVSVFEIFISLLGGATLYLTTPESLLPGAPLIQLLQDLEISSIGLPPLVLSALSPEKVPKLKTIVVGGEACSAELAATWAAKVRLLNAYGPTEATVFTIVAECTNDGNKPVIGRPIANTQAYVLDKNLNLVPPGVPGELYIGGVGLARGYLNRPELTVELFIPNPFSDEPGARLYRTKDLARYLPDGNIDFLGRVDSQVKVRGFRIELGEIEATLIAHPQVKEAVVLVREDQPGNKSLVAYMVLDQSSSQESVSIASELRRFLQEKLPGYMVPSGFVTLESFPMTPNGKVDRRALPAPGRPQLAEDYVMPRTEAEQLIAAVWQEVLQLEMVGVNDNFFNLGGHSLLLVKVQAKLNKILKEEISIIELFQHPTIDSLARHLNHKKSQNAYQQQAYERATTRAASKDIVQQKRLLRQEHRERN
ncbi:non-ribosomal peptide synthetase [Westiellopsis prolifica IICB1]|nr:non-ribosomal peptide synthetase [Westiellopsis prolifica IICB1]